MESPPNPKQNCLVLIVPFPAAGHRIPVVHFAKYLALKGLQIQLLLTPAVAKTASLPPDPSISSAVIYDGEPHEDFLYRYRTLFRGNLDEYIAQRRKGEWEGFAKLALVYDSTMGFVQELASKHGMIGAAFFTEAAVVNAVFHHVNEGNLEFPWSGRVSLPCLPEFEPRDLPAFSEEPSQSPFVVRFMADQFVNLDDADWVLFNTFTHLESEVLNWFVEKTRYPVKAIGPTLLLLHNSPPLEPKPEAYKEFLDSNSSVVFASCGSVTPMRSTQMEELAYGLLTSNHKFLWVVRDSELEKLPKNFDTELLTPDRGMIVNWCDQIEVLSHPAVSCFVTHCGWNSVIEAISHGVPMIGFGVTVDQITNAKLIQDLWGIGIRLSGMGYDKVVGREEIAMRIEEVVGGEKGVELKKNCLKWKELARDAVSEGGTSLKNVEEFVQKLLA